jgi:hypothetical protein
MFVLCGGVRAWCPISGLAGGRRVTVLRSTSRAGWCGCSRKRAHEVLTRHLMEDRAWAADRQIGP